MSTTTPAPTTTSAAPAGASSAASAPGPSPSTAAAAGTSTSGPSATPGATADSATSASPSATKPPGPAPTASPVHPTESGTSSASSVPLADPPSGTLIAVAFHALHPETKRHHIRPAVCTSSAKPSNIAAKCVKTASASSAAVTDAFNAAIDLVRFTDEQLARPPTIGETFSSMMRPASKEMGARIKKAEKAIGRGHVEVPGQMSGWKGERRVQGLEWAEFSKAFEIKT